MNQSELSQKVRQAHYSHIPGPPGGVLPVDVEPVVAEWKERHPERIMQMARHWVEFQPGTGNLDLESWHPMRRSTGPPSAILAVDAGGNSRTIGQSFLRLSERSGFSPAFLQRVGVPTVATWIL